MCRDIKISLSECLEIINVIRVTLKPTGLVVSRHAESVGRSISDLKEKSTINF